MSHVAIRFLILHKELGFALNIKRTLEQFGGFDVLTFTALETALNHLKRHPQNIMLVDMNIITLADLPKFRAIQPDILIIGSPNKPQLEHANLDALVDTPINARELLPILQRVLERHREQMPPVVDNFLNRRTTQTFQVQKLLDPDTGTMEFILQDEPDIPSESSVQLFEQLAAEEPPMPPPLENGILNDIRSVFDDTMPAERQRTQPIKPIIDEAKPLDVTGFAEDALKVVADETTPLNKLNQVVSAQFPDTQGLEPLPSWVEHLKRYVNEPDFLEASALNQALPKMDDVVDDQTPTFPPDVPPPPAHLPETPPEHIRETIQTPIPPVLADVPSDVTNEPQPDAPENDVLDDSQIIQMALNFTQASLGMTAEFSLLTQADRIVAHSGDMLLEEVEDISQLIAQDWQAEEGQARVRFITLPSSGKDYMIYSRQTERDLTLSLIFAGGTPFNLIRKQGERLLDALTKTPELPAKTETVLDILEVQEIQALEQKAVEEISQAVATTAEIAREHGEEHTRDLMQANVPTKPKISENKQPYTLVWMTRTPETTLSDRTIRLLTGELEMQLRDMDWTVEDLQIYEDYIYLMAYIPLGEASTHTAIADVKARSAQIVETLDSSVTGDLLWADAYCALSPAREMDTEEIQYFINFART